MGGWEWIRTPAMLWVEKWPIWERWPMDLSSGIFSTLHTAEVGVLEEVWDVLREWECPLGKSVPSCSVGGLRQSWSYSWAMCELTKFKSCIRSQPQSRAWSKTKPHEASNILALTTGHVLSSASSRGRGQGVRWKTLAGNLQNWLLANGIKKYQNISKNVKKLPGLADTLADLQVPMELPYAPEVCPGGQDTDPSPLKTLRICRNSKDIQATAGTASPD